MPFSAQEIKAARHHLRKSDSVMNGIIKSVGPFTAKIRRDRFLTLVNSILGQQISCKAADSIRKRLIQAAAPDRLTPETILRFSVDQFRELGISRQKANYLLDLANHVATDNVQLRTIGRKDDQAIIDELTQIKGIGVWTAQMFLIFSLGRLDVFPDGDLGIKNGILKNYPVRGELTKAKMNRIAKPWRPYATIATWYLWRSLENVPV